MPRYAYPYQVTVIPPPPQPTGGAQAQAVQPVAVPPAWTELLHWFESRQYELRDVKLAPYGTIPGFREFSGYHEGFLLYMLLETDSPNAYAALDLNGDNKDELVLDPGQLYEYGLLCPQTGVSGCVSRTATGRYVAVVAPQPPGLPFASNVRLTLGNRGDTEVTVARLLIWLIERRLVMPG